VVVESDLDLRYTSAPDRRAQLVRMVEEQGFCTTTELSVALGVSDMTIRRDVRLLVAEGHLRSVHGGVSALPQSALLGSDFRARAAERAGAKAAIAQAAAAMVRDGDAVGLDAGSTALEVAKALPPGLRASVVTHSVPVVTALLGRERIEVTCLGGTLHHESQSFGGPATTAALADLRLSVLYLAASGISAQGVYCGNDFDAVTKRALVAVADRVVLVADSSKFATTAMVRACPLSQVDCAVIDDGVTHEQHQALLDQGVEVVIVPATGGEKEEA